MSRKLVARMASLAGLAVVDLDLIWGLGRSVGAWVVRVAFWILLLWSWALSRSQAAALLPHAHIVAEGRGHQRHSWQGALVVFTEAEIVVFSRSVVTGQARGKLSETPYGSARLVLESRNFGFERVRCEWADGLVLRLHLHVARRWGPLEAAMTVSPSVHSSILRRVADWFRAGTEYEA